MNAAMVVAGSGMVPMEHWEHFRHEADIGVRGFGPTKDAEEAPGAYKDVSAVVGAADHAHLARKVAKLEPIICVKG